MKPSGDILGAAAHGGSVLAASWSPDGEQIAFILEQGGRAEVFVMRVSGQPETQRLTAFGVSVPEQGDAGPSWAPAGNALLTLAARGGGVDVVEVCAETGAVSWLTDGHLVCGTPRYAHDGRQIAFTVAAATALRDLADPPPSWDIEDNGASKQHLSGLLGIRALWVMKRDGTTITRVMVPGHSILEYCWHPIADDRLVVVAFDARLARSHLVEVVLATNGPALRTITRPGDKQDRHPTYNSNGDLAYLSDQTGVFEVWRLVAGEEQQVTLDGHDKAELAWDTANQLIYTRFAEGYKLLEVVPAHPKGNEAVTIASSGVASRPAPSPDGDSLLYLFEAPNHVPDLRLHRWRSQENLRLTRSAILGSERALDLPYSVHRYASHDGLEIEGFLVAPEATEVPPPVVIYPHGGPTSVFLRGWNPFLIYLARCGIAVFAPNFRGSTGYGRMFERANDHDWGGGDLQDLVQAVDFLGKEGLANPKRAAVFGGSYGGYLTLLALTKFPSLFRCGVDLYGVSNRYSSWLTTDFLGRLNMEKEMGHMATHREAYHQASPINFVAAITAPLLILHGEDDPRVPVGQSDELAEALKAAGKFFLYHKYPNERHGFKQPENQIDAYRRIAAFLRTFL